MDARLKNKTHTDCYCCEQWLSSVLPPEAEANRRQRTMATTEIHVGTLEGDRALLPAAAVDSGNYQLIRVAAFCPSGIQMKHQPL